jgi:hypothetical protein
MQETRETKQGRAKVALMAKAWTMQGGTGHWPVLPGYQPG